MQPTHIDELLGGTWQWERDDDDSHGEDLEQLHAMLDELVIAFADA
jgi:hypothetical protein